MVDMNEEEEDVASLLISLTSVLTSEFGIRKRETKRKRQNSITVESHFPLSFGGRQNVVSCQCLSCPAVIKATCFPGEL